MIIDVTKLINDRNLSKFMFYDDFSGKKKCKKYA